VISLGTTQSAPYEFNIALWCLASSFRLLLEGVQHVHRFMEAHRVNGAIRIAFEILDQFDGSSA